MKFEEILKGVANNTLTDTTCDRAITKLEFQKLLAVLRHNQSVKKLSVLLSTTPEEDCSEEGKTVASLIGRDSSLKLEEVYLLSTNIGDIGADAIGTALNGNNTLKHLVLTGNKIHNCVKIAGALNSCALTFLRLDENDLDDVSAIVIAEALRTNNSLFRVSLTGNNISRTGLGRLDGALKTNLVLEYIDILQQKPMSDNSAEELIWKKRLDKQISANQIARLREISGQQGLQLTRIIQELSVLNSQVGRQETVTSSAATPTNVLSFTPTMTSVFSNEAALTLALTQFQGQIVGIPKNTISYQATGKEIYLTMVDNTKSAAEIQTLLTKVRDGLKDTLGSQVLAKMNIIDATLTIKTHNPRLTEQLMAFLEKSGIHQTEKLNKQEVVHH